MLSRPAQRWKTCHRGANIRALTDNTKNGEGDETAGLAP
jgi:hypothetical protein